MSIEHPPSQPPPSELDVLREGVSVQLRRLFEQFPNPEERKKEFENRLDFFMQGSEDIRAAALAVIEASVLEDRAAYEQAVLAAMVPLMRLKISDRSSYEELRAKRESRWETNYPLLTELIGYEFDADGWMRLHVPDQKGRNPFELRTLMRESMRKLADYLREHPEIPGVVGTSWLVADKFGGKVLERLGFTLEGPIDEATRRTYFEDETRPVAKVRMSREEILKRYGKE